MKTKTNVRESLSGEQLQDMQHSHSELKETLLIESIRSAFGLSGKSRKRNTVDDAWLWIVSEDNELPFSFDRCCRENGLDTEKMLNWLRFYHRKQAS